MCGMCGMSGMCGMFGGDGWKDLDPTHDDVINF